MKRARSNRTDEINYRIRPSERLMIEVAAAADGVTVTDFARETAILAARRTLELDRDEDYERVMGDLDAFAAWMEGRGK
jgi:uncharacterized protein (DUF1778 family)